MMRFEQAISIFKNAKVCVDFTKCIWRCNSCNKFFSAKHTQKLGIALKVCPHCKTNLER